DLIDEATSALKMQLDSKPIELDRLNRRSMQLQIELAALKKDKSEPAKARKGEIENEVQELQEQSAALEQKWQREKELIDQLNASSEKLEQLRTKLELAERDNDLATASRIVYGEIPELEKTIAAKRAELDAIPDTERMLLDQVSADDIAAVV